MAQVRIGRDPKHLQEATLCFRGGAAAVTRVGLCPLEIKHLLVPRCIFQAEQYGVLAVAKQCALLTSLQGNVNLPRRPVFPQGHQDARKLHRIAETVLEPDEGLDRPSFYSIARCVEHPDLRKAFIECGCGMKWTQACGLIADML